jgi:hypothetical protein
MLRDVTDPTSGNENLTVRFENTTNAPIDSVTWLGNGQAIAGTYLVEFTKSGVVTADVTGQGDGSTSRNPWGNRSGLSVTADSATVNKDLVPGIGIVVNSSTDTGWIAVITVGNRLTIGGVWTEILEFEIVQSGATSSARALAIRNIGSETAEGVYLYALPGFYFDGTLAESAIAKITNHSNTSRHKLASTEQDLVLTLADRKLDGGTGKYTYDVMVGANKAVEDAQADGATVYEHGVAGYDDGNDYLAGLAITLPDTAVDLSTMSVTLSIRAGYTWVEWAPDVTGSPGTWQSADWSAGNIAAAAHTLVWIRVVVPSSATPDDPCRMVNIRARGLSI